MLLLLLLQPKKLSWMIMKLVNASHTNLHTAALFPLLLCHMFVVQI